MIKQVTTFYPDFIIKTAIEYFNDEIVKYEEFDEKGYLTYIKTPLIEKTYKDGKLDGLYREWYPNGQLFYEKTYKDGQLDGLYRRWYSNGQLWDECTFKDGKLDGISREWYPNGRLSFEYTHKDDNLIS